MVPFLFHGAELYLFPCGAVWWRAEQALLVADLHFEKARFFAAEGQYLPPYDSYETALALAARIEETGAKRIICLGDSFHDAVADAFMPENARGLLHRLAGRIDWIWITGNHDEAALFGFGRTVPELQLRGIALRHEALKSWTQPEMSGHFHPKIRLRARSKSVSRRCFLHDAHRLILPAFGVLTGGLDARHPAIHAVMSAPVTALVPGDGRLLRFPVEARIAA